MCERTDRRQFLNTALIGAAGAGALLSQEERILQSARAQGVAGGEVESERPIYEGEPLEQGKIGNLTFSRLILGGNLIGGFAHSRDLLYVSRLLREYNTEEKIFETLAISERSGIDTIQLNPGCWPFIEKYRREMGGKIKAIVNIDAGYDDESKVRDQVQTLVGQGAEALYTHGIVTDRCIMNGLVDQVAKVVEIIHDAKVPAGIGGHSLETPIAAEKAGIPNDFYVKTFHPDTYWSASPPEVRDEWCWYRGYSQDHDDYHDNIFCVDPKRTVDVMASIKKPWMAFKVMAAGAVNPQIGFNFAFQNGADFVIAGMFDFQVADDVGITVKALKRARERTVRAWMA